MKAIVNHAYGSPGVLTLKEIQKPTPGDDEVLVEVHAASANPGDWHLMRGAPFLVRLMFGGLLKPKNKILGADVAGRVEAVGRNVNGFQAGDEVFGDLSNQEDLVFLRDLFEAGKVSPVIDRRYALAEVPAAIRYLEAGHARGKVVITF